MSEPRQSHEPFAEWAALSAAGALEGDERLRFEAHLAAGCETCEQHVRDFGAAAAALAWALPHRPMPAGLRGRILARAAEEAARGAPAAAVPLGIRTARPLWPRIGGLVAAGLVGALAWGLYDTRSELQRQHASISRLEQELQAQRALTSLVSGTDTGAASLQGTGGAERADGWITWSPSRKRGFLVVHNLPPLPAGRQYQLWVLGVGDKPTSAGVFDVDSIGHAALEVAVVTDGPPRFAITAEPAGGGAAPSGLVVMRGGAG
jgi:anti-sigma-K factor RskA